MKRPLFLLMFALIAGIVSAENMTDIHLQWKDSTKLESSISSETGNLYNKLNHHGPAIENQWIGLRYYFDYKCAIDIYNKTRPGLELAAAAWYPTKEQQKKGWGADQYKVGTTVGCGGVRLWDGEKVVYLDPVSKRTARVKKEANISYLEMLSEGIPYKGKKIDVLVRVTVFSSTREAKVEAFALCDEPVQFVTGINYFPATKTTEGKNFISTWGIHPEDVAAFQVAIGAAIIYNPDDYVSKSKLEKEFQLISKPTKYLSTWVSSACEKEKKLKNNEAFNKYLEQLKF